MILDWRAYRYRGGSGWYQSGLAVVSVGVIASVVAISAPDWITFEDIAITGASLSSVAVTGSSVSGLALTGGSITDPTVEPA